MSKLRRHQLGAGPRSDPTTKQRRHQPVLRKPKQYRKAADQATALARDTKRPLLDILQDPSDALSHVAEEVNTLAYAYELYMQRSPDITVASSSTSGALGNRPPGAGTAAMRLPPLNLPKDLHFGPFPVTSTQAFHISSARLTYALVNLRPLLPGHTLICPVRRCPRLSNLTPAETIDLFATVRRVSAMLERVYKADALNIAIQDGAEAGQSVNHVHVHIIPRRRGDVSEGKGDEIYERMEGEEEGNLGRVWQEYEEVQRRRRASRGKGSGEIDGGGERRDRGAEEMEREAEMLRWEMERQGEIEELREGKEDDDGSGEIP